MKQEDISKYRRQFNTQKSTAAQRGIEWQFTFEEWMCFWGDDIDRRGTGHDKLCMQRFHDKGPYHPLNVKKGYAMENAKTAGVLKRSKNIDQIVSTKQTQDDWAVVHSEYLKAE